MRNCKFDLGSMAPACFILAGVSFFLKILTKESFYSILAVSLMVCGIMFHIIYFSLDNNEKRRQKRNED